MHIFQELFEASHTGCTILYQGLGHPGFRTHEHPLWIPTAEAGVVRTECESSSSSNHHGRRNAAGMPWVIPQGQAA